LSRILFARVWGPFADKFGSKVVLSLSVSLYLLVILAWTYTGSPGPHFLTVPLLVVLHIFAGIATSGINLTDMTLRMKLAPQAQATAYLTGASLAINLGSGVSPLIGGFLADFFSVRELTFTFGWSELDPSRSITFAPLHLSGFDFLFVLAFILGLLTLNTLTTIREEGEVDRQVVLDELLGEARESFRAMSSVPGLGFVSYFPYSYLRRVPGLDVAVGVTAYQLASSARPAVAAATRGRAAVRDIADQVSNVVSYAIHQVSDVGELGETQAAEIARHATRGAIHAIDEVTADVGHLAKGAVPGAISALSKTVTNPRDILRGVGLRDRPGRWRGGSQCGPGRHSSSKSG
jgi:MFS family permease